MTSSKSGARPPVTTAQDEDAASFLAKVRSLPPSTREAGSRGRLIFAMDATMSRQPTWDRALAIQSQMFAETGRIGGLDVQLVYFRGFNECRASNWVSDPQSLARIMTKVECRGGNTQIAKVLAHIKREASQAKVNAALYAGDAMEENIDALCKKAGEIGLIGVPLFMFQENGDPAAERAFREIARLTRGAYFRLDASAPGMLRELLAAVAVYAAGGRPALTEHSKSRGGAAVLLLEQMK
ncbi:MAG: VWA domain-containing protein [Hyphomicrobiales bacterium]